MFHSESLPRATLPAISYRFRIPFDIPQGTAVPHWAYFNVTVGDISLPSDSMLVLTFNAKTSTNQTYDQATMITVGRKFDPERASFPLFTFFH